MKKWMLAGLVALAAVVVLSGCSGGGWIFGQNSSKATFGFTYDNSKDRFQGTYRDGYVQLAFTAPAGGFFNTSCPFQGMNTDVTYRSTNPSMRGSGTAHVDGCDNGEGQFSAGDTLDIYIYDGPFGNYSNSGTVQGNFQSK